MPRVSPACRSCFLVLATVLLGALPAAADTALTRILERGSLVLGTSGNMPSMSQVDAAGKLTGFDIDLARIMADMMGVRLEPRVMPFAELLPALESGQVDVVISNLTITPRRNLSVAFVGPYMKSGKCIVSKSASLAEAEQSPDINVPDVRLAVMRGSTSEAFARELLPQATVVPVDDYAQAVQMVIHDEINGLLTDYPICLAALKDNPGAGLVSRFSLLTYEPIGIALPAGDAQFVNWTENYLDRMDGTGGLDELGARWFGKVKLAP